MAEFVIDIKFNLDTSSLSEAEEGLSSLRDSADEVADSTENISGDGIEEMGASAGETADNIKQASDSMGELGDKTDETNQKMQETAESSAGIGTALAGIGGAIGFDAMIQTGDNINTSWNRLSLTFAQTGVSMDTLKKKSSELNNETGRSGGEIREYFNQMGLAGVTNVEVLSNSFEAMSGKAYQTGNSIQSMTQKMSMMAMSGNASGRMLKTLGINTTDLADALGVTESQVSSTFKSLSETERLEALSKAMGDGTTANEMYKNSYAGLKAQAETSLAGLTGAIGQSILPVVIPALNTAKSTIDGLTGAWKMLPAPVQQVFGALGGGIVGLTAVVGAFGVLGSVGSSVVGGLKSMKAGFDSLRGAMGTARTMIDAVRNAESISQGIRSALAIATGVETASEEANAVAKASAVAPTSALAIAENSLLLPILLVVGAIVGLIAVLYYLYNNNEQVRQGIDNLIKTVQGFINTLIATGTEIFNFVSQAIANVWEWVTGTTDGVNNLVTLVMTILFPFPTLISQVLSRVLPVFISTAQAWITNTVAKAKSIVNGVYNALTSLPSKVSSAINGVKDALTKPFTDAWNTISPIINQIQSGINTLNDLNPFSEFLGFEGFEGEIAFEGVDNLNSAVSNSTNSSSSVVNNFNINGIIEEEASQYIVDSMNSYMKKQNLIRGV